VALLIEASTERLLYSADAALHPLHLAYPAWYSSFDWRPEQGVATRRALFAYAAAEKCLVLGCHFPFPGLGYVGQQRTRWQWRPLRAPNPQA
jgi:glyoxylase-like metal-dependent hydrolase (beta-lactamase superfamily II)